MPLRPKLHDCQWSTRLRGRWAVLRLGLVLALGLAAPGCQLFGFDAWLESVVDPVEELPEIETPVASSDDYAQVRELPQLLPVLEGEAADYVARVAERLVRYTLTRPFEYRFLLLDAPGVNSFSLPGGFVYLTPELLGMLESEDELAAMLAHELIHATQRSLDPQRAMLPEDTPLSVPAAHLGALSPYAASVEAEADRRGRRIMAAAGYDPAALESVFERILARDMEAARPASEFRLPPLRETHRLDTARLERLHATLPEIRPVQPDVAPVGRYSERLEALRSGAEARRLARHGRLVQPELGFALDLPEGWEPIGATRGLGARSPDGRMTVFTTVEPLPVGDPPVEGLATMLRAELRDRAAMEVAELEPCEGSKERHWMEGWSFAASLRSPKRDQRARIALFRLPDHALRVTAVVPGRSTDGTFEKARSVVCSVSSLAAGSEPALEASSGSGVPIAGGAHLRSAH